MTSMSHSCRPAWRNWDSHRPTSSWTFHAARNRTHGCLTLWKVRSLDISASDDLKANNERLTLGVRMAVASGWFHRWRHVLNGGHRQLRIGLLPVDIGWNPGLHGR